MKNFSNSRLIMYHISAKSKNLANNPAYQKVLVEMRATLKTMRKNTKDPWLINDNYKANQTLIR